MSKIEKLQPTRVVSSTSSHKHTTRDNKPMKMTKIKGGANRTGIPSTPPSRHMLHSEDEQDSLEDEGEAVHSDVEHLHPDDAEDEVRSLVNFIVDDEADEDGISDENSDVDDEGGEEDKANDVGDVGSELSYFSKNHVAESKDCANEVLKPKSFTPALKKTSQKIVIHHQANDDDDESDCDNEDEKGKLSKKREVKSILAGI
ncbi:hypothetical protein K439DRAFT_1619330 [Ramaria rubella]|nr:hypothetical protein K439DRAFT_1619330 [Ramaria rubella]